MVRIKHRYLLINILYPDTKSSHLRPASKPGDDVPYTVQFRRPSPDQMNGGLLMRLTRDGVAELFGDYGSGKIAGSLQGATAIIRVSREHYRLVWAALTFTTRLPRPVDQPCVIQVAIRRARLIIRRAEAAVKSYNVSGVATASATLLPVAGGDDDVDMFNGIEDPDEPGDVDDGDDG
ncbi:hypothetical protein B0A55_08476 [Friedmanniomyces simplex]|uniref:Uncharacterized protein n=1 Tax=Friedmanniomyces simplex TaxID=329884 RepID=A0A4U0WIN3_9PEZI|nr:hypothetical protein B0A55_11050 [Friedmanniomyces simplex]TKA69957.1 hypothetical protein B0A55_08476 [Friedmanniomyces simplex]